MSFRSLCRSIAAFLLLLTALTGPVAAVAHESTPVVAPTDSIRVFGIVGDVTLSLAEVQALPAESVDVTFTASGEQQQHSFTGTTLLGVLEHVGLPFPADARNPLLQTYLVVTANDGYQVVISGGELDPAFGNVPMLLAWEQDGAALDGADGPLRLVVPGDTKGGRYVHGIVSIEVLGVDQAWQGEAPSTPAAATPVG